MSSKITSPAGEPGDCGIFVVAPDIKVGAGTSGKGVLLGIGVGGMAVWLAVGGTKIVAVNVAVGEGGIGDDVWVGVDGMDVWVAVSGMDVWVEVGITGRGEAVCVIVGRTID